MISPFILFRFVLCICSFGLNVFVILCSLVRDVRLRFAAFAAAITTPLSMKSFSLFDSLDADADEEVNLSSSLIDELNEFVEIDSSIICCPFS